MKKILILFCFAVSTFTIAQNQRFSYEYVFVKDSTKINDKDSELMYLDIAKKGSKFYSQKKAVADSLQAEIVKSQKIDFSGLDYGNILYVVEKLYPDFNVLFFNSLDMEKYKVSDSRKMNWKISSVKAKIGDFDAQKATVDFAGRQWTAWFVTEIPIQDGPYKFHGLPGLIIKIEDQTKSHSFILKEIKNLSPTQEWISDSERKSFTKLFEIDEVKYKKQFIDFRNNPSKSFRQFVSGGGKMKMVDEKGNSLDIEKVMRDKDRAAKENNAKDNNLLELELLK